MKTFTIPIGEYTESKGMVYPKYPDGEYMLTIQEHKGEISIIGDRAGLRHIASLILSISEASETAPWHHSHLYPGNGEDLDNDSMSAMIGIHPKSKEYKLPPKSGGS
ncbi:MAG: hypothetical protein ACI89L_000608 [Phycisphaerales bacterium]|jgi:hypothetical protein